MMMQLQEIIHSRFSPTKFLSKPVDSAHLKIIFEAGRWSPSCFNEQPWRFLYAHQQTEAFQKILSCLVEKNQEWAKDAPLLIVAFAKKNFTYNNKPNKWSWYDTGQSVAHMTIQALQFKIYFHQMGGFNGDKIRENFRVSEEYEPTSVIACGYLDDDLIAKERAKKERTRKSLEEIAAEGKFIF
jgi:nitroreductase